MKSCNINWCKLKYHWLGYCDIHYRKFKKYWDPLFSINKSWEDRKNNKLYVLYCNIKTRCYNKNSKDYSNYWWRWITVCDRWLWVDWFTNFCNDMWERPEWYSIDRINNNWNYESINCKWSSKYEQNNNKRNNNICPWTSYSKRDKLRIAYITEKWLRKTIWYSKYEDDIIRIRKLYKAKCPDFLEAESKRIDKWEVDMETEES